MKISSAASFSPLVVTEHGTGFFDTRRRELRKAFGVHVSPEPREIRMASAAEASSFFRDRAAVRADVGAYYDRSKNTGD